MTTAKASPQQISELAETCASQAAAIAAGTVLGPRYAAALRLQGNVDTLLAWLDDDR